MKMSRLFVVALMVASVAGLTACSGSDTSEVPGKDVIAPVSVEANDLEGQTIELVVGQVLNINTGSLSVDSYSGEIEDTAVAKFIEGSATADVETNPGVEAVSVGETAVTMTNEQGGIRPLSFTVVVSPRQ